MKRWSLISMAALTLLVPGTLRAGGGAAGVTEEKMTWSGFVSSVAGAYINYQFVYKDLDKPLSVQYSYANLNMHLRPVDRLTIHLGMESMTWYSQYDKPVYLQQTFEKMGPFFSTYIDRAEGVFTLLNNDAARLELGMGFFPYKYNPQAQNFGEYLFRTGTYPGWVRNNFDWPLARISGIRLSSLCLGTLSNDLMLTREGEIWPLNDLSVTDIAGYSVMKILDVGAGVQFARILPANKDLTSPRIEQNILDTARIMTGIGPTGDTLYRNEYTYYTATGTKLMLRGSLDPKGILDLLKIDYSPYCKKNDGKIYGEAAVLGLANQGKYYDRLDRRLIKMAGVNWFTHPFVSYPLVMPAAAYGVTGLDKKITQRDSAGTLFDTVRAGTSGKVSNAIVFGAAGAAAGAAGWLVNRYLQVDCSPDIISLELEYYGCNYPNSVYKNQSLAENAPPLPSDPLNDYLAEKYDWQQDNWKWSLYFSKTIAGHFRVIGQLARDHSRLLSNNAQNTDYSEAMVKRNHWAWMTKAEYNF